MICEAAANPVPVNTRAVAPLPPGTLNGTMLASVGTGLPTVNDSALDCPPPGREGGGDLDKRAAQQGGECRYPDEPFRGPDPRRLLRDRGCGGRRENRRSGREPTVHLREVLPLGLARCVRQLDPYCVLRSPARPPHCSRWQVASAPRIEADPHRHPGAGACRGIFFHERRLSRNEDAPLRLAAPGIIHIGKIPCRSSGRASRLPPCAAESGGGGSGARGRTARRRTSSPRN